MKKIFTLFLFIAIVQGTYAQIDGSLLLGLTQATTSEISSITNPAEGSLVYNTTEKAVYQFDGSNWISITKLPLDLAHGDDDTTYSAGDGLLLKETTISVDQDALTPDWSNIKNIPTNLDTDSGNEIQKLSKSSNKITLSNGGGSIAETETGMKQDTDTGKIYFINEASNEYTANVISEDENIELKTGSDGGVYLEVANSRKITYSQTFGGRAYYYNNRWYSLNDAYGVVYFHWNSNKGVANTPTYNIAGQAGVPITRDVTLIKFVMKNDFTAAPTGTQQINLAVLRSGSYINIGTYDIKGTSTNVTMFNQDINFELKEDDLLVWSCRNVSGGNLLSYASITYEFGY